MLKMSKGPSHSSMPLLLSFSKEWLHKLSQAAALLLGMSKVEKEKIFPTKWRFLHQAKKLIQCVDESQLIPRLNYDILLQLPGKEKKKKENILINVDFMKFLSTQRLYTLNDLKKFINTEDYSIIGEMHHFLKDQLEKLKHNTSYKYLDKALRPKIIDLKMLLTELMSNYETTIFKSSRELPKS